MVCHGRRSHDQSVSRLGDPQTGPALPDWHRSARQGRTGRHPERLVERSRASATHAPAHPAPAPKIPGLAPQFIDQQDAALAAEMNGAPTDIASGEGWVAVIDPLHQSGDYRGSLFFVKAIHF